MTQTPTRPRVAIETLDELLIGRDTNEGTTDRRLRPVGWRTPEDWKRAHARLRLLLPVAVVLTVWYFEWLLRPVRVGNPVLYGLLVCCEFFNVVQAVGFWWTCIHGRVRAPVAPLALSEIEVDVLVPVYNEPIDVVAPTIEAAVAMRGGTVNVYLLDDAGRADLAELAARTGAHYICRPEHHGAKAGNLNHALALTEAPFVAIFDCDHVPEERFFEATLGHFRNTKVGFVQTPQYYANADATRLASAAWSQQALFFGGIALGKDGLDSMICCGTNVVFRRAALEDAGYFPEGSLTEDFALSILLHERGWRSVYVSDVLARGLGPEDMASYVSQQRRWARGCLAAIPLELKAALPWRVRLQYLLSSMFFLSGWTVILYMALPVIRMITGAQPLAGATAAQFLVHFAPYFGISLFAVAVAGAGEYTMAAFALLVANFAVQLFATALVVLRRKGRFVVTPKRGVTRPQPGAVWPALAMITILCGAIGFALHRGLSAATLNNVAFGLLHISVLLTGCWSALVGTESRRTRASDRDPVEVDQPSERAA